MHKWNQNIIIKEQEMKIISNISYFIGLIYLGITIYLFYSGDDWHYTAFLTIMLLLNSIFLKDDND